MTKDSVAQDIRSSIVGGNARSSLAANTQYAQVMKEKKFAFILPN